MESKGDIKHESDRSSDEKVVAANLEAPHPYVADLPPDPDAHLSPEERAAIVSLPRLPQKATFLAHGLTALLGSQTPLEAGFDVDSMGKLLFSSLCEMLIGIAVSPVSAVLPGQNEHRKCQNRPP